MSYEHNNAKGIKHYLRYLDVKLRSGKLERVYFFTKNEKYSKGEPCDLPDDREVFENPRNNFLTVRRKKILGEKC